VGSWTRLCKLSENDWNGIIPINLLKQLEKRNTEKEQATTTNTQAGKKQGKLKSKQTPKDRWPQSSDNWSES